MEPVIPLRCICDLPKVKHDVSQRIKAGWRDNLGRDEGMIDKRALMFLFIVLMAAFAAIALIILISGG